MFESNLQSRCVEWSFGTPKHGGFHMGSFCLTLYRIPTHFLVVEDLRIFLSLLLLAQRVNPMNISTNTATSNKNPTTEPIIIPM